MEESLGLKEEKLGAARGFWGVVGGVGNSRKRQKDV